MIVVRTSGSGVSLKGLALVPFYHVSPKGKINEVRHAHSITFRPLGAEISKGDAGNPELIDLGMVAAVVG